MAMKIYSNTAFVGNGSMKIDNMYLKDGTPVQAIVTRDSECTGVTLMMDRKTTYEDRMKQVIENCHNTCEGCPILELFSEKYEKALDVISDEALMRICSQHECDNCPIYDECENEMEDI